MFPISLDRNLVFFDIESTGLNVIRDRIMQIALIRVHADGSPSAELEMLINPGVLISEEAYAVHGIGPKDVANKPTFEKVAKQLYDFIGDADLAGYNSNRFDVPMLMEEFARAGLDFDISKRRLIDAQRIFYRFEPRTLSAALAFYAGKKMENAHDALADVRATIDVFAGQLERYGNQDFEDSDGNVIEKPLGKDLQTVHQFCANDGFLDVTNRIKLNAQKVPVFNFGKYQGQPVGEVCANDPGFYNWLQNKDFTQQVKKLVRQITEDYKRNKRG
ncbi:MAG: 3'-5' exonuclease [Bacteroidota bacterium]